MVKRTQTICRLLPMNYLSVFDHFARLALIGLTKFSQPACILENSDSQKLLGVTIDRKLNFNEHVTNLCDKASKKIQALASICPYIPQTQKLVLMNSYFMSQFDSLL